MTSIEQAEDWVRAGRHAEAFEAASALLRNESSHARALIVRVNAANALGRLEDVIDGLQRLLRLHPLQTQFTRLLAIAINNRGLASHARGDTNSALKDFHAAIELLPAHPQAWFNLGLGLRDRGQNEASAAAFARHLALNPNDRDAQLLHASVQTAGTAAQFLADLDPSSRALFDAGWMAQTATRAGQVEAAVAALERLEARHDLAAATEAISELRLRGEAQAAMRGAARVAAIGLESGRDMLRAELVAALALPAVYADSEDLAQWRTRFDQGLTRLESEWTPARLARVDAPLRQLAHSNFLLAYQGRHDLELQSRFAALIERAAAAMHPEWCEPLAPRRSGRIGLLSSCWRTCTVGSYFGGWIAWLREAGYSVHLYQLGPQRDAFTESLGQQASVFRYLEDSIESVARTVRNDDLDLLIYPEIGMDARLTPLASLRLARKQAAAWGHPVSTGFTTIDEYLTCGEMEPSDGTAHYRERLIALPGLGVDYRRPDIPPAIAPQALGLDPARPRVLVPQSVFKLHPEGDAVMAGIAARLPRVQFVLFAAEYPSWMEQFQTRLARAFASAGRRLEDHLVVQPLGTRERFLQVNRACDLMLDTLHWSGGNTAIDALLCGLPVVACPGAAMRGRQSLAMLRRLGLEAALAPDTPDAQVARAVELLTDAEQRRSLSQRIEERLPDVFESDAARVAMTTWAGHACET